MRQMCDTAHAVYLKIGETRCACPDLNSLPPNCPELNAAVDKRIRQYTQTAAMKDGALSTKAEPKWPQLRLPAWPQRRHQAYSAGLRQCYQGGLGC